MRLFQNNFFAVILIMKCYISKSGSYPAEKLPNGQLHHFKYINEQRYAGTSSSFPYELDCSSLKDGYYPNPSDCQTYYKCYEKISHPLKCRHSYEFDPIKVGCTAPGQDSRCKPAVITEPAVEMKPEFLNTGDQNQFHPDAQEISAFNSFGDHLAYSVPDADDATGKLQYRRKSYGYRGTDQIRGLKLSGRVVKTNEPSTAIPTTTTSDFGSTSSANTMSTSTSNSITPDVKFWRRFTFCDPIIDTLSISSTTSSSSTGSSTTDPTVGTVSSSTGSSSSTTVFQQEICVDRFFRTRILEVAGPVEAVPLEVQVGETVITTTAVPTKPKPVDIGDSSTTSTNTMSTPTSDPTTPDFIFWRRIGRFCENPGGFMIEVPPSKIGVASTTPSSTSGSTATDSTASTITDSTTGSLLFAKATVPTSSTVSSSSSSTPVTSQLPICFGPILWFRILETIRFDKEAVSEIVGTTTPVYTTPNYINVLSAYTLPAAPTVPIYVKAPSVYDPELELYKQFTGAA